MNLLPTCVLHTQDAELVTKVTAYLDGLVEVRHVQPRAKVQGAVQRLDPGLVIIDLRLRQVQVLIARLQGEFPESVIVALGIPRSDPVIDAEQAGVYSAEDVNLDRHRFQSVTRRALAHLRLVEENRALKDEIDGPAGERRVSAPAPDASGNTFATPLGHFSHAFRHFEDTQAMLETMVEGVGASLKLSRAGVFAPGPEEGVYGLRAGLRCMEEARELVVTEDDPLVRWLQLHAHLIARTTLEHIEDRNERLFLRRSLDVLGADVIVPLHGRYRLLGWLFVGRRVTGIPFDESALESLTQLADTMCVMMENALLYEELTVQKTLAETLLDSVPVGIVAVDESGTVRWFNRTAEGMYDTPAANVLGQPTEAVASRLAGLLADCAQGEGSTDPVQWVDPPTQRSMSVITRRLGASEHCRGAVAIISDETQVRVLRDKQQQLERMAFWTELAAAMSHAVRNPLVAISTFAQLLPEKYEDAEFRDHFSQLVAHEVGRLDAMIDQLTAFAHPSALDFRKTDLREVLENAVERVSRRKGRKGTNVHLDVVDDLPPVRGDPDALVDCFASLFINAIEAVQDVADPIVSVTANVSESEPGLCCVIDVTDNGPGISPSIRDNVFSPFCTMKTRGIGLGLPIAKRTVLDHEGRVTIDTGDTGTRVQITLPALLEQDAVQPEVAVGVF